jgi:streptogramin lyase
MAGCSGVPVTTPIKTTPVSGVALRGIVHGGRQPIVGAHVYLYAASTSGYGGASNSLLTSATGTKDGNNHYYVTTGPDGTFSISNDYTCPDASTQVYLYSIGGDATPSVPNAAAGLLAGLGSCDTPNFTSESIIVNEVSTVATAFALAGFTTDTTHIASSSTALATMGMADGFKTIANLESLSSGVALGTTPAGNGTVPQSEIYTLANILAACVNTNGSTAPTDPCGELFSNAMNGVTTPSDTATAAINIAHNPGANIGNLFGLQTPGAPFQPGLSGAPNDFTIAINYTGGGLDGSGHHPEGIAVDGLGNVWVPNFAASSVSELSPLGAPLSGSSGITASGGILNNPTSVAIDLNYNAWVASFNSATMTEINRYDTVVTSGPPYYTGAGLANPYGAAIYGMGTSTFVWVTNNGGNTLSEFEGNGVELSGGTGFSDDDVTAPTGIAMDTSGNAWYVNGGSPASIGEAIPSVIPGTVSTYNEFTGGGLNSAWGIAIDASGNIWLTNRGGTGSLSEYSPSQSKWLSGSGGFTGGGIDVPYGLAVDGGGNVWTANYGGDSDSISEFNSSGVAISGPNGYVGTGLFPYSVAIDPTGNVWVANNSANGAFTTAPVTEFVGAATPVVTPLAAGAGYDELGTKP